MNRRTFVSSVAAVGAVAALPSNLFAAVASKPLKVGLIGCGWFGNVDLGAMSEVAEVEVVSLCDPNTMALEQTLASVAKRQSTVPKTFADFREMLSLNSHDVVIVGTPDHWHALPAIAAMKAGADVILEKPISLDVMEGEALVAAARKYGRVVQVNLQRRSTPGFAEAKERYIDSGKIGKVGLIECFYYGGGNHGVLEPMNVPQYLDYDLWAGPSPKIPYVEGLEGRWRQFMEYGNGTVGDMGVHILDLVRYFTGLGWPERISSTGGKYMHKDETSNIPDTQNAFFHYPDLDVSWEHRRWGKSPILGRHWTDQWGASIIGENGTLHLTTLSYAYEPKGGGSKEGVHMLSKTKDLENLDFDRFGAAYQLINARHMKDFLAARDNRSHPIADVEEGHISSASRILANLALELGRPLAYDPKTRTVLGDEEATKRLSRVYNGGWIHPDPASVWRD